MQMENAMEDHKDKVFLITGSSSGIGEGIAVYLAGLGAKLSLTGRNQSRLDAVKEQCLNQRKSGEVLTSVGNIASRDFRKSLVENTVDKFGKINVLVNNAGFGSGRDLETESEDHFDEIMDVNMKAPYFLTQLVIPYLKSTKGCIINISSALSTTVAPRSCSYAMTKAALDAFTKGLAIELAPYGIRANAIRPGHVQDTRAFMQGVIPGVTDEESSNKFLSEMAKSYPLGRVGEVGDIANMVSFLASERSCFMTGEDVVMDGGHHLRF